MRSFPQGWTLVEQTGKGGVAQTLDALLDSCSPHSSLASWEEFDNVLTSSQQSIYPEENSTYRPQMLITTDVRKEMRFVLNQKSNVPDHLRLTAFGLGIRTFDKGPVALTYNKRPSPFTLVANNGFIAAVLHR
ncbi:hypothetical protein FQ154_18500 [Paeniglutamicibacter gangotriensis]|uniref:Uncharacterized protein n=1 Tax=Paeniglutamicibacter gangotriensis TaxID=254787 RepID=A0A5B0E3Y6_9MICC|nr:hypothetical protein [Paeniglutamicibacter gangotriensis]KAA0973368.1 hypothetical protein FQ154_18500 [Paeniglutamicibacter gangotriensis]